MKKINLTIRDLKAFGTGISLTLVSALTINSVAADTDTVTTQINSQGVFEAYDEETGADIVIDSSDLHTLASSIDEIDEAISGITSDSNAANKVLVTNNDGGLTTSSVSTDELNNLSGSSENIQTQLVSLTSQLSSFQNGISSLYDKIDNLDGTADSKLSGIGLTYDFDSLATSIKSQGTANQTLKAGKTYTVEPGYYAGGTITAEGLDTQTVATGTKEDVLKGKTVWANGEKLTGTMENKSGKTVNATTVTESGDNALITVPAAGYYDATSQISVPVETIKENVTSLNSSNIVFAQTRDANALSSSEATSYTITYKATQNYPSVLVIGVNHNICNASLNSKLTVNGKIISSGSIISLSKGDVLTNTVTVTYNSSGRSYGTMGLFVID